MKHLKKAFGLTGHNLEYLERQCKIICHRGKFQGIAYCVGRIGKVNSELQAT